MDEQGWHARRRAAKIDELYSHPQRAPDGHYIPVEVVQPINEPWVGGFGIPSSSPSAIDHRPEGSGVFTDSPPWTVEGPSWPIGPNSPVMMPGAYPPPPTMERLQSYRPLAKMTPHLQFLCGPLLNYDTVDEMGIWRGACMIVTADAGSIYEPHPMLRLRWDPDQPIHSIPKDQRRQFAVSQGTTGSSAAYHKPNKSQSFHHSNFTPGPSAREEFIPGQPIWVYRGSSGSFTFFRFLIQVPLSASEMGVRYCINGGQEIEFVVPGRNQNMRWAAYSCNGFSAGINPEDFCGPGHNSGYDPVWNDLLDKHDEIPFHVLVGGGDQIYCDALMREPELAEYISLKSSKEKKAYPLTNDISAAIDRFYFSHYCIRFRDGAFAKANSTIPMKNQLDDHDLIDGFGSYPADLQSSPIFSTIGSRGYHFFLLFQCFISDTLDGLDPRPGSHTFKSMLIGGPGPWIPFPSHSFLSSLGPRIWILLLDCRAERKKEQVCSQLTYKRVFDRLHHLPGSVEHLVIQLGIPIAYPRMNALESALESKFNPLIALGRSGSLGLGNVVNKFNKDAELLDDLNDHWTSTAHKKERNWVVEQLQQIALAKKLRITFLSGDVHCAAVGYFKTLSKSKQEIPPGADHRYMLNVVTSAIVNTPPPVPVLSMVSLLSDKKHKTMHYCDTDESMIPLFAKDTNGTPLKNKNIMGRRNWCAVSRDEATGDLIFDIRVEIQKGEGRTVSYPVRAPPPRWNY